MSGAPLNGAPAVERVVVEARTHGRYLLRASGEAGAGCLVIGFHGYAEAAEIHLAELERIPGAARHALVAVDGLHAFYDRKGERVLRGWMTRDLRAEAIEDNLRYVRSILDQVRPRFGWRAPLVFAGFSQGVAMAWRAAVAGGHGAAALLALAGDVPPELLELPAEVPFPARVLLARGDRDTWYDAGKLESDRAALAARGVTAETLTFAGDHEWTEPFRAAAGRLLADLVAPTSSCRMPAVSGP